MSVEWYQDVINSEKLVLGLMLQPDREQYGVIDRAAELLAAGDFFSDGHQLLFREMIALRERGQSVDFVTLLDAFRASGHLARWADEGAFLDDLRSMAYGSVGIYEYGLDTHCEAIRAAALKRTLHAMAQEVIRGCSERRPALDIAGDAERAITNAVTRTVVQDTVSIREAMENYEAVIEARQHGGPSGLMTGLKRLDSSLGGLNPGDLVILAARPSIGKTALALEMCTLIARRLRVPSLFVSLEMPRDQLLDRMVASTAEIDLRKILEGDTLDEDEAERLRAAAHNVRTLPIWIDDAPRRTLAQIAANARRKHREGGLALVAVDYLQLVTVEADRMRRNASREEAVADISRRLKELARELRIPVLCLCQLNRQPEGRKDHKPQLGDLRESGAIEQDADKVVLLHRPCFYNPNDRPGEADVIIAKNRNGRTGTVVLQYAAHIVKFRSLDPRPGPF